MAHGGSHGHREPHRPWASSLQSFWPGMQVSRFLLQSWPGVAQARCRLPSRAFLGLLPRFLVHRQALLGQRKGVLWESETQRLRGLDRAYKPASPPPPPLSPSVVCAILYGCIPCSPCGAPQALMGQHADAQRLFSGLWWGVPRESGLHSRSSLSLDGDTVHPM